MLDQLPFLFPPSLSLYVYVSLSPPPPLSLSQAERKEYARQSRAGEDVMRERVEEVREMVHEEQVSKKEIANGNGYIFVHTYSKLF